MLVECGSSALGPEPRSRQSDNVTPENSDSKKNKREGRSGMEKMKSGVRVSYRCTANRVSRNPSRPAAHLPHGPPSWQPQLFASNKHNFYSTLLPYTIRQLQSLEYEGLLCIATTSTKCKVNGALSENPARSRGRESANGQAMSASTSVISGSSSSGHYCDELSTSLSSHVHRFHITCRCCVRIASDTSFLLHHCNISALPSIRKVHVERIF